MYVLNHYSISVEEYLDYEKKSHIRHEYINGEIFAMSGASVEHNQISINIVALLRPHLRGSKCRVFMSDMKVKITQEDADFFYYPDIFVTCSLKDTDKYFKIYPKLIIEVLSKSTKRNDLYEKRINYQSLSSLQEYVLIDQEQIRVIIYRKDEQGNWQKSILAKDDQLELKSADITLTMSQIYEDVEVN
jgi:Uma2 family endonuclease